MRSIATQPGYSGSQVTCASDLANCYGRPVTSDPVSTDQGPLEVAQAAERLSLAITTGRARMREEAGVLDTDLSISQLAVLHKVLTDGPVTATALAAAQH